MSRARPAATLGAARTGLGGNVFTRIQRTCLAAILLAAALPLAAAAAARADGRESGSSEHISFKAPIDFATGAPPSAVAFNAAAGDQLGQQLTHATLSDSVAVGDFNR